MGWKTLADKVLYLLKLHGERKARESAGGDSPEVPHGEGMPLSVNWQLVASWQRESYKVSSIHPLSGGKVLIGCYNNAERGTSRLHVVGADGSRKEIWKGGEETIGQGWAGGGQWWLPVEKPNGDILGVPLDGSSASPATPQGGQYAARIVDGHVGVGNRLFQIGNDKPVAEFPRLGGIISGLVFDGGEWIACDDERGIQGASGWFIEVLCPELALVNGRRLAFLRTGEVRLIENGQLSTTLGHTRRKCRRAWVSGGLCWWTTAPSDGDGTHGVWCTDGNTMRKVGEFPGLAESTQAGALGSLFGSAICVGTDGAIWCATTDETQNGWVLYRGIPEWPMPSPSSIHDYVYASASVQTAGGDDFTPPARTGSPSWQGKGTWNAFKDEGRAGESSSRHVTVEAWVKAESWSGGGKEQAAGFCVASKGRVGSHWGLCFFVRPDGLVWNATKGEVVAPCKVKLGVWYHVKAVADRDKVRMWLDGEELDVGEKTFAGALIQDSGEPLRIGGYYTDYAGASWFNQSLDGEITDWKVEME